ncbi:hypothetical protein [Streptomyces xanthophaeus]|uniref:hypothetical protein n=1 Tax=Streptomyces xanthophaeus TaxID=67385 RepID=UPI0026474748|nr:hypothetical protein [Streptomyces xanthophaeus]WKD36632.1 hypothetical protein KO717_34980 [Streptomyces xanthophaeus]
MITNQCRAATKKGERCRVDARPSGLCHTHDPVVRCRVPNTKGKPCVIATGGGPCHRHEGQQQASVEAAMKLVRFYEPAGADPLFAVERPAVEEHASPPGAASAGEPGAARLTPAFVARTLNLG